MEEKCIYTSVSAIGGFAIIGTEMRPSSPRVISKFRVDNVVFGVK